LGNRTVRAVGISPENSIQVLERLKEVLRSCWDMISQDLIDGEIDQSSKRITMVIQAQGGHTEHRLK